MIGVFDSGVGGLYALRELRRLCPQADLCYFADEANLPYGTRTPSELLRLSARALRLLLARGARAILCACGTVSSTVLSRLSRDCPVPLFGAALPLAEGVAAALGGGGEKEVRVALLATERTVTAGVLAGLIRQHAPQASVESLPCPAFVFLAERLSKENATATEAEVRQLLAPFADRGIRVAALGCTHFSALSPMIGRALGSAAIADCALLSARAMLSAVQTEKGGIGKTVLLTSGNADTFARAAAGVLGGIFPVFHVE